MHRVASKAPGVYRILGASRILAPGEMLTQPSIAGILGAMTKPLNLCRQMALQLQNMPHKDPVIRAHIRSTAMWAPTCQKFILPKDAALLNDPQLRGLDSDAPFNLPYPAVALEFESTDPQCSAIIIFATNDKDVGLIYRSAMRWRVNGVWTVGPITHLHKMYRTDGGVRLQFGWFDDEKLSTDTHRENSKMTAVYLLDFFERPLMPQRPHRANRSEEGRQGQRRAALR